MSLKDILKNKKVKIIIIISFILIICIIFSIYIVCNRLSKTPSDNGNGNNKEDEETESTNDKSENGQTSTTSYTYGEDCIYYETEKGYIANTHEDNDKVRVQLKNSSKHFTFEFQSDGELLNEWDKTFILVNLENQYCRYKVIFNHDLSQLTHIILHYFKTDSLYTSLYEGSWSGSTTYPNIDIFHIPTDYTEDRYQNQASVLSHELVHIFQFDITNCLMASWYIEGMALVFAEPNSWQLWEIKESINNNQPIPDSILEQIKNIYPNLINLNPNSPYSTVEEQNIQITYDTFHLFYLHLNDLYGENKMIDFFLTGISKDCHDYYSTDGLNTDFKMYFGEEISDMYKSWVDNL